MPTIIQTTLGRVTGLWGSAVLRTASGKLVALKMGDLVHKGDVVLTTQDGIVQLTNEEPAGNALAAADTKPARDTDGAGGDIDRVIAELNTGEGDSAPAAGLVGGDGSGLTPGLRVGRIAEGTGPSEYGQGADAVRTELTPYTPPPQQETTAAAAPAPAPAPTPAGSVSLASSASTVVEGGSIVYTASVGSAVTGTPLVITLSNGETITIPVGQTSGSSAPVAVRPDDIYSQGPASVVVSVAQTSGGSAPLNTGASVTTTVTDDSDATSVTLTSTASSVSEGGSIVYTATLAAPVTGSPLVLGLSNGQTITIPVGASSGSSVPFAVRGDDVQVQGTQTLTVGVVASSGGSFEALTASNNVSTSVVDNADTTTATLSVSHASVVEGGSLVYTVTLNNPVAGSPLVVNLSNGQTITIPVGASSASSAAFVVRGDDAHAQGIETLPVGISGSSGGNFEALNTAATVSSTVTDDADTTAITISSSTASVAEGGSVVYTATVNGSVQGSPLVIQLSNGQTITIPVGASSASAPAYAVRADDGYAQGNQTLNVGVTHTSGGDFESLSSSSVATVVTDNGDDTSLSLSVSNTTVTEGGSLVYTVTVGAPVTGSPLVVTLSNGQTVTIPVGSSSASSASVTVRPDDAHAQGDTTVSASITGTSGGNYESIPTGSTVTTVVTDDSDSSVVTLTASASSVNEGGSIVYTATVNNAVTGTPLVITLNNGQQITIPVGASSANSAAVLVRPDDAYVQPNGTVTASISATSGGNYEALTTSSTATTTVTDDSDSTLVTLSASAASVNEGGSIVYTATVANPVSGSALVITLDNGQTITIPVGASSASSAALAVRPDDANVQGSTTVTASITGTAGGNYEHVATGPAVSTTVTDDSDATTVTLTASSANVTEGGSVTYTATLSNAVTGAPFVVTLSNGQTITIPVGQSSGSSAAFAVRADNAYVQADDTLNVSVSNTSGGHFEAVTSTGSASTVVSDDVDATTVTLVASATTVAEGGSIVYIATLNNAVQGSPLTITLSNGSVITIPVGLSSGTSAPYAVRPDDAQHQAPDTVTAAVSNVSGGNFEAVTSTGPVSTTVVDNATGSAVTLSASATSVTEGGGIVYTASVDHPVEGSPLTITLTNGQTITIPVGQSSADSAPYAVRPDDPFVQGTQTLSTGIAGTIGGNYESLATTSTVSVGVTDDSDVVTVSLNAYPVVDEGGTILYVATLTAPAATPVTVTLSNGQTITIPAGDVWGIAAVQAPTDDVYVDGSTVSVTITGASGGGFENLQVDATPAVTAIDDTIDATTLSITGSAAVNEGATASYTVSLTSPAHTAVTVTLTYSGTAADGTDFTGVATVTIPAGASSANFSVASIDDALAEGAENFTVTIVSAGGGGFESLVVSGSNGSVTTGIVDNDTASVSLSATPSISEAGGNIVYTATVTQAPTAPLTVTLSNGATITVAAGALSGTVSVAIAASDDVYTETASTSAHIASTSGGGIPIGVDPTPTVTAITDTIDTTTVTLTASPSVDEGGQITYTVSLTAPAHGAVTVILDNGTVIGIANGASSGSVTVPAPSDDVYTDASTVTRSIGSATGGGFENLAVNPAPASTSITDTANTTTVSLSATPAVAEGGSITYTATLTSAAATDVTVQLDNGQSIVIVAGSTSGSIAIPAPSDDVYVDAGSIAARISTASGGGFENLAINNAQAVTTVSDTTDTATVTLSATPAVAEGGNITYTASLSAAAQAPVTVTLDNGTVITIPTGASSASISVAAPADDVYVDGSAVTRSIATATGGNFENLVSSPTPVSTQVTDTPDTTTVTLTATPSVAEGGHITYTASLTAPAQTDVTVTLSNSQTIVILAGTSSGTVSIPAPGDDVYADAGTVSATISGASGGGYENLAINPAAASTSVTDTVNTTTVSLGATPSVAEGGSITYTASLTSVAQSDVTVTLDNGHSIVIVAGSSSGSISIAAPGDDVYVDSASLAVRINTASGGGFENLAVNNAQAVTSVTDTVDTTTVSLTATPSVSEGGNITYTASLNAAAQGAVTVTLDNGTVITIASGASSGSVTVAAPSDDVYVDAGPVTRTIATATGGNFENLATNPAAAVTAVADTTDTTTVTLSATPTVTEGGSIVYTATLSAAADTPVTITLSNNAQITIAAGSTTGTVAVAAHADTVYVDAQNVSATIGTATGGGFERLEINPAAASTAVTDDTDTSTVTLSATPSIAEGGQIVYTASLSAPAQSPVTVTLDNGTQITIAAGSSTGTVSLAAPADDVYADGSTVAHHITSASGGNFENLAVDSTPASTTVTDTVNTTTVSLTGSGSVAEGASASYTVSLTSPALTAVTINFSYSGTAANGSDYTGVASVTIPAGASSASFSVATLDDSLAEGSENFTVAITSASGGGFENLVVSGSAGSVGTGIVDNDISTVSLSATSSLTEAGGSIVYTATLTQAPIAALTVTLSNGAVINVAAGELTGTVSVPVAASDDVYRDPSSVSATIASTNGGSIPLAIDPTPASTSIVDTIDASTVTLSVSSASVAEGGAVVYTATIDHAVTGSALVLNLSNGQTITIPVGQTSASSAPSVLRPDDAYTQGSQTVTVSVGSHSGGNFEAVVATSTTATTVSDDVDTSTVTLTASTASVAEGGSITYTATVNNPVTGSALVVSLSNGQTITIPVGSSSASSPAFAVRGDDAYAQGTQTLNVTIGSTAGGNYENLATAGTATTTVTDDSDSSSVTLSASSASVTEGGSITYTATVSNVVQGSPLVVHLSNGLDITIPVGQSSASSTPFAVRADDAYQQGTTTVSAGITGTSGGNFEAVTTGPSVSTTVTDDSDATSVTLTASSSTVTEGGSVTYTATLSNAVTGSPLVINLSNGQQITIPVGASSGSTAPFAVRGDDAYVQANDSLSVSVSNTSGGNFEAVTAAGTATTTVTDDSDASVVTLTASASTVNEGGSITYTATVSNAVTGSPLVITLNNGQVITIPVGQSSASSAAVPVRADDAYVQPNGSVTASISHTAGGNYESLATTSTASTTVTDDADATTVTLTASSASVTEGGSVTYTATLSNAVTGAPFVVTLSNGQTITIPVGQSSGSSAAYAVRADDAYVQANDTLNVTVGNTSGGNFEAVTATGSATTSVVDDADATVVTLTPSATTVNEGGAITYTATVSNPVTGSALVLTLNNGQTITIPVGQSSGTSGAVAVRTDDAYVQPNGSVTASISGHSGGNFESLTTTSTASTTVTDDGDASTVTLSASATSVAEGGSITYTATVNNPVSGSALVVSLSNGQTITIPVGASSASSTPFAVRTDDVYVQGNGTVSASITGTTGGSYEAVATGPAVSTTVTDDADATTVTLSASSASVNEGGSITYTATVNNVVTGTPLVVTLNNGQQITIPVGASSASSAAVPVRADDAYAQGPSTVSASISGTSGGNFEALTTTSTASTTVTDDGDATAVTLTSSTASVTEGGSIVYTATVASAVTGSALVINLSNGQSITIPVGQTSASSAAFAVRGDDVYHQGTQTLSVGINSTSGGNFEALNTSSTTSTTVTDDSDATTVTLTASSATVNEGGAITYTATVNNAVTGSPLVITLNNGQVITIPVGASSASSAAVPVRADDAYVQPNGTVTASISNTSGGNYEALTTTSTASTTVTDDSDATTVTLTASATSVTEGGSITYTATVSNPVSGSALVVTLSNGQTITIPVGASSASSAAFAVRADDAYVQGNGTVSASISGTTGGNYEAVATGPAVSTTVTDDSDSSVVTLTASSSSVNEGGSIVYTATINNAVSGTPLVITLNNGQVITIPVGASSASSAAVPVRADDAYVQPNGTVTASISNTSGGNYEALTTSSTATTTVTDDSDSTLVTLSASATSVTEGGSIVYTATVANPVSGSALVVTLSNGQTITIPVGASSASGAAVPVRADDAYVQGNGTVSASITGTTGGNYEAVATGPAVSTTVTDDSDATTVTLTASSANVTEGGSVTYTATLSNAVAGAPFVVTLSNGQTITIPVGQSSGSSAAYAVRGDDAYVQANDTLSVTVSNTSGGNFEAVTPTGTATTTVRDDADSTVVTLTPSATTVNEGGSVTYTATVNNAVTGTPLVITLNNGQTITIPVGQSSGSSAAVPVRADDAYVQPNGTVSASISSTSGGNYEALTTSSTATTTVTDDGDVSTVTLTASATSVTEGGAITYTATVNNAVTGTPLVVTLSNGQTITIPVGQSSASSAAFAVRADDAYHQGNATVSASISGTTGGNFESVATGPGVSTTVTDDSDATTVSLTASSSTVTEGGSITYTATLNNAVTGTPFVVTLSNGQTITIPVGQSSASSTAFAVRGDDAYVQGTQTLNVTVSNTSGANFEAVTATGTATTTVTDDSDSTVVTLTPSASTVVEGGSITYTATVNNVVTGTPLVVTLNNGQVITIPVGSSSASSAAVPVRGDDAYVQGNGTVNASISNTSGGNYESLTTTSTVTTTVTDDADATTVTLSASASSVVEGGSIVYTATVNNAVTGSALVVTLSNGQTITIPVGQSSASSAAFPVRADDAYVQGNGTVATSITTTSGGNFEAVTRGPGVSTTVTDDSDATTVTLTASSGSVSEGGSITYTATLSNAVTGSPLTVTLSNGQTITIPVGASSGTSAAFAVRGDDAYVQGNHALNVTVSNTSGGNFEAVTATGTATTTVTDDSDSTVVTLTASSASIAEGGSITYTATVNNAVTGTPLVVTLNNGQQITIPVGSSSASSAAVPVRADDAYAQGNQTVTASISNTSGGNYEALTTSSTASTTVTDDGDASTVTLTASSASVVEGGSITYTATVANAVSGTPLVITLSNGQTITIPVGQTTGNSAAFAVRGDDAYVQGSQVVNVGISGTTGGNYEALTTTSTVSTTVTDDSDATTVTLSASAASVAEGGSITYTATVNNAVTGSALVVTLSNGQTITIPVGQSSASSAAFPVRGDDAYVQGNGTVATSITTTSGGNFEAVTRGPGVSTTVTDDSDATTVTLTASSSTVSEGGSITYTATLNNAVTGTPLVVTLSNGQTITIPVGQSSASSTAFAVRGDDAYVQGTQTLNVTVSNTSGANFEAVTTTGTATTTVTDDADSTVVTLTPSATTVVEGGSITYTATVNNAVTGTPLVITLNNGQVITIPVGSSSASSAAVPVRADDAYVQPNGSVAASISSTSGGNYESLTTTSTASTTVTDDADATTVTLSASASSVVEGGSIVYTASVNNLVTGTPLVVTLSNGQTITIPVGQSSASSAAFPVRADDAYHQGNTTVSASISGTTGGSYEAVATGPAVSTTVTDDSDATTVTLTASSSTVTEGGSITYTATLNNAVTGSPFVVTLSNGQTITIPVGQSSGSSAAFAVRGDDAYTQGTQTLNVTTSSTSGGNFEAVTTTGTATTTVTDDADSSVVTLSASATTVAEGGSITYTATVSNPVTGSALVLTLSNGQTITIPVGASSASTPAFAVRTDDAYVQGTQTLNVGISSRSGGNFEALTTTSTVGTTVTDDSDATTVTLSASAPSVAEGGSIVYTATVNNAVTGTPLVVTLSNGQTITIPVGSSSASSAAFAVRGDDAYVQGNQAVSASISGTTGGNYESVATGPAVSTIVTDDADATVVTLTASAANVTEGGSIIYTATVNNAVTGTPLVVTLSNNQTITIPVGQSSANSAAFAVRADDAYAQGNQNVTVSVNGTSGGNFEAVTATGTATTTVTDDADPTTVTLGVSSPTVVEGGSVTYTATLSNAVTGSPLTINLSNGLSITIPVGQSSGTSAGYVVRADDAYAQGSQAVSVGIASTSGGSYETLTTTSTASTTVGDDTDTTTVSLSGATSVTEGGNAVYTLTLSSPAATAVTVTLTYGGTAANGTDYTAVTTVTIPAGASSANFTVPTSNDTLNETSETIAISINGVSGGGFEAIAAHSSNNAITTTITDNDPVPTLAINDVVVNEAAGTATFTVTLSAASGQQVTVGFGTSNGTATAVSDYTAAGGTLTFAPGVTSQTITVTINNDGTYEGPETFNVNLSTPTNATIADNLGIGTIRDDGTGSGGTDNDTPTLSVSGQTVAENGGYAVFTVSLSNPAAAATTVSLATVAGTATAGTDYATTLQVSTDGGTTWNNATSATFAAGATSVLVRSAITNDTLDEVNETFSLVATTTAGATTNASATAGATITDDDPTPTLVINDVTVNEAAGTATFTVTLSTASGQQVTVNYGTGNGTATAGTDFTTATGTLTFAPGVTSQTITVPIINDTATESTETFNVNLTGATNATIADNLGVGSIVDNDARSVIDLDANNSTAGGSDYTTTFTENGSPVSIADTDIAITDVDSTSLAGATITLTNAQAGDLLAFGGMPAGITASLAGNVITLSGNAALAAYQTAIRAITFANGSENPNTADRIITVTVNDGTSNSLPATTYVHVAAVNDAPEGRDVLVTTAEDVPYAFSLGNFLMNDAEQGNNVNASAVRIDMLPSNGSLFLNGALVAVGQVVTAAQISAGQLTFVPALNDNGNGYATLNFSVRDAAGDFDATPNVVTVNVTPVSDGSPLAGADAFRTTANTPIIITQAQLLANDALPDHARITAISALTGGGTLVDNGNGTWTYTPAHDAVGNTTFTYTLTDDDNQTSTATVTLNTVAARDDLAIVHESALTGGSGGGTTTASGNLFTNDGGGTVINSINGITDGSNNDTDSRAGFIGVTTTIGRLVVDTTGQDAGNYTYTLNKAADNSAAANNLSVTETFNYDSNGSDAALRVTVVDDKPVTYDRNVEVSQTPLPSYALVLVLDVSGSMTAEESGGEVRQVNADGSTTIQTRLAMAKAALVQLVNEYYAQSQSVSIKLITFSDSATILNGGSAYASKEATIAAINAITGSGGTNYQAALNAVQTAFGTVDPAKNNAVYFLSDGEPSGGNTTTGVNSYTTFVTNNNIDSYGVGIGTGIANPQYLNAIHNVDADGSGAKDPAIIVPDLNQLGSSLISTVPPAFGGNVVANASGTTNVLGADGGYIQTVTLKLDSNGDGTPDTDVTFTYNKATNQISQNGFLTGYPKAGDLLTIGTAQGLKPGTLSFNFSTGNYTFYTNGTANEGDSFTLKFVARDGDGDVTPQTSVNFEIANGHSVARPDTDTVMPGSTHTDGNVITGLGTDGGLALGNSVASFSAKGAGVDIAVDHAKVTAVDFGGQHFNLLSNGSGSGTNYIWNVTNGQLTWTGSGANAGQKLVFNTTGYYDYTPPTAGVPAVPTNPAVTTLFNTSGNADDNGVVLTGLSRTGAAQTLNYNNPNNTSSDGVGVDNGLDDDTVDNLERLVVTFSQATHPYGVHDVSFVVSPNASNLGPDGNGVVAALTYTVYDVAGNLIGQFYSDNEGTVTVPPEFSNIGSIQIEANSAAEARITSVTFEHVNLNSSATEVAPVQVGYTLTDDQGDTSSSSLTLNVVSNNIYGDALPNSLDGTAANDRIIGGDGNDVLNGMAGNDIIEGGRGNDQINGGAGHDMLRGGEGNDVINGGDGNDIIVGGSGSDNLTGGNGSDVFRWEFADQGANGSPTSDTVMDFNTAAASAGGDVLDFRDLLQGETLLGAATGNLTSFLHFAKVGSDTVIQISSSGGFSGGFNAGAIDQSITLVNTDLTASGSLTTDQQIIQDLMNKSKLLVDGSH